MTLHNNGVLAKVGIDYHATGTLHGDSFLHIVFVSKLESMESCNGSYACTCNVA